MGVLRCFFLGFLLLGVGQIKAASTDEVTLWCAAGLCKTGNTFLRPLLHKLHDPLKAQGVLVVRSDFHHGNNRLAHHLKDPRWLQKRLDHAKTEGCHTVLLFSENLFLDLKPESFIKRARGVFPQVKVSFCVRDFYPLFYTLYQEYRKADKMFASWPEWAKTGAYRGVKELTWFLQSDVPLTLINYDVHRKTLVQSLFSEMGIEIDWSKVEIPDMPRLNRSVALPEWNIMEVFRQSKVRISPMWACKFWHAVENAFPGRTPFRYYDVDADRHLYKRHATLIANINKQLPERENIPTEPYVPHGYTTEWDATKTTPEDVMHLVNVLGLQALYGLENKSYVGHQSEFPEGFNPYVYASENIEILPKKEDPFIHYLSNT